MKLTRPSIEPPQLYATRKGKTPYQSHIRAVELHKSKLQRHAAKKVARASRKLNARLRKGK